MNPHLNQERLEYLRNRIGTSGPTERLVAWPRTDKQLPVVDVEIDWARFSTLNHRLKAEQQKMCRDRNQPDLFSSDPLGPAAQSAQLDLLTNDQPREFQALKENLRDRGQQEVAVVTAEGVLVNGNRRAGALRELLEEGEPNAQYIRCFVLPKDASLEEIRRLETELQVSERFLEEYSWINRALLIDELLEEFAQDMGRVARIMHTSAKEVGETIQVLRQVQQLVAMSAETYLPVDFEANESAFTELAKHITNKPEDETRPVRHAYFLGILGGCNYRDLRHLRRSDAASFIADEIEETPEMQSVVEAIQKDQQAQDESEIDNLLDEAIGDAPVPTAVDSLTAYLAKAHPDDLLELGSGDRIPVGAILEQVDVVVTQAAHEAKAMAEEEDVVQAPIKRIHEAIQKVERASALLAQARALSDWDEPAFADAVTILTDAIAKLGET